MKQLLNETNLSEGKNLLIEPYRQGCKKPSDFKVGLEFEKIGINKNDATAISYSGPKGIEEFLRHFKNIDNWNYVFENSNIIGLKKNNDNISLEPGNQFELSTEPQHNLHDLWQKVEEYNKITAEVADRFDISWLGYGIQPVSVHQNIELIPKKRYEIMTEYLPKKASLPLVMMRETAGIQVCLDYESEEDAIKKYKTALALSPIATAMFANSPIRQGKDTGYKSFRAYSWQHTDNDRCGLVSEKLFSEQENFGFDDYAEILLDLPMLFLQKDHRWFNTKGMSFRDFIHKGFEGHKADFDDWILHSTSFFPDVRLKNHIEIRSCDAQQKDMIMAVPAFWKGILYDANATNAALDIMKSFDWSDLNSLRTQVAATALNTEVKGFKVLDIARELAGIAYEVLKKQKINDNAGRHEGIYLQPLLENLAEGLCPADKILSVWDNSVLKLAEYTRLD